ncbi:MAG: GPW/gp25 family protein [Leptolyngbyaceae cyanobacterium MO_188.B28]|nr:GPW/gp25 family protein [Leptolyngbyaceae cyanobacterium MO_188.B28]
MPDPSDLERYIGQGITFPTQINTQGGLQLSSSFTNIEESIYLILRTNIGERVYRPDFGSRLAELVFAPLNPQTLLLIRLYVEEALNLWEPRITLDEILTDPDPVQGRVDITITYFPKDSPNRRSLVYPFYLLPPDGQESA